MPPMVDCGANSTLAILTPSLLQTAAGISFSPINPHLASAVRTCGNEIQSVSSPAVATCRMCRLPFTVSAMRNAWAKASALASEKSVGWTIERMAGMACLCPLGRWRKV